MADCAEQLHSSWGIVTYTPEDEAPSTDSIEGHFRGRCSRPGTVQVFRYSSPEREIEKPLIKKLALKENAKRFLRSFTLSQSTQSTSTTAAGPSAESADRGLAQSTLCALIDHRRMTSDTARRSRSPQRYLSSTSTLANDGPSQGYLASTSTLASSGGSQPSSRNASRSTSPSSTSRAGTSEIALHPPLTNEKPVASAGSISVSIALAEPMLFLHGFEPNDINDRAPAILRGSLVVRVTKTTKIKSIYLHFTGKSRTEWPEGLPPKRVDFYEERAIMHHTWPFFDAKFANANHGPCADHVRLHSQSSKLWDSQVPQPSFGSAFSSLTRSASPTHNEQKRTSLPLNQSRSACKGEPATNQTVTLKGYRTFQPGDYVYNFELPLDSHLPETINVELGSVKYKLEACVERAGAFRQKLVGHKEISVIRAPAENSLEQVEPIAISRNWEDQLHYDIVISGKSFPLGSQIPIAFKLTPLAKVQCHRIKVLVTENVEYWASNRKVHRLEPHKKIPLLEKRSDGPTTSTYPGSTVRILSGGGVDFDSRAAAAAGNENVRTNDNNLLGSLEGEHNIGPTEMEFSVQLPSCSAMKEKKERLHFDTTFRDIRVHHWIKIIMRLSRPDKDDPSRRRHFEISIDSPFHILSCQATPRNTSLPAYSSYPPDDDDSYVCGCPDAPRKTTNSHGVHTIPSESCFPDGSSAASTTSLHEPQRPIHLIRLPSYHPPDFDDDVPPPLLTPPPLYDSIISTQNPLADYFLRRREENLQDESNEIDVTTPRPRIDFPSGRVHRSMDEQRTWAPIGG